MLIRLNCLDWDKYFLHEQNADGPSFLTNWEDCFLLGALYSKTPNLGGEGWGRGSITCFQVRPCCSDLLFFLEIVKRFGARSPSLDPCTMLKWNLFTISHVNFDRNYGRPFGQPEPYIAKKQSGIHGSREVGGQSRARQRLPDTPGKEEKKH